MPFEKLVLRVRGFLASGRGFGWRTEIERPLPDDQSQYATLARLWIDLAEKLLREGAYSDFEVPSLSDDDFQYLIGTPLGQELVRFCAAVEELAGSRRAAP